VTETGRTPEVKDVESVPVSQGVSFRAVFEAELGYVWNTLRRLGVREADLKDQAQEVFVVVHGLLPDYDASRPIRPWLFAIAYRIALRYRALARNAREIVGEAPEVADSSPSTVDRIESEERRALVLEAVQEIDLSRRAVFVMSEIDEVPVAEVAVALGIPLNTAYSRLRLARQDFAAAVQRARARRRLS
jgi:RNA polymerase sigma-70 factor, ECF subfamily